MTACYAPRNPPKHAQGRRPFPLLQQPICQFVARAIDLRLPSTIRDDRANQRRDHKSGVVDDASGLYSEVCGDNHAEAGGRSAIHVLLLGGWDKANQAQ